MEKIIVVPDTHGRDFYRPVFDIKDTPIVFLGDYLDPYLNDDVTPQEAIEKLKEIIEFAKNNPLVTLLAGNHCEHYIWSNLNISRFALEIYEEAHKLYRDNIDLFKPCLLKDNVLFTHAGVTKGWCDRMAKKYYIPSKYNILDVVAYIQEEWEKELQYEHAYKLYEYRDLRSPIFDIGYSRYGTSPYGGPFWCDIHEMENPLYEVIQIFAHSQLNKTGDILDVAKFRHQDTSPAYCCDSRAIFVLENNKLQLYEN